MYEVTSREFVQQPTLVVRGTHTVPDIPGFLGDAYHKVAAHAADCAATMVGPPFARYRMVAADHLEFEIEAGIPIASAVAGSDEVEASSLPGGLAAVTWHIGEYADMEAAYTAVMDWIADQGGRPSGPPWEVYHSDPNEEPDPARWRTEVIQPYLP